EAGLLGEAALEPGDRRVERAAEQPVDHAESEEVLAAVHALGVQAGALEGAAGHGAEIGLEHAVALERAAVQAVERVGGVTGAGEVALVELVAVDDQDAVRL